MTGDSTSALQRTDYPDGSVFTGGEYSAYPISIYPGQRSTIWVDVYVPPDAEAGMYNGEILVKANTDISARIPITLQVWDFELPDKASHRTHLGHFCGRSRMNLRSPGNFTRGAQREPSRITPSSTLAPRG